jgi:uncharacterized protein (DUF885 family)
MFLLVACGGEPEDGKFDRFAAEFLRTYFSYHPVQATVEGDHSFDHRLDDLSRANLRRQLQWLEETEKKLKDFSYSRLSLQKQIDYAILMNQVRYMQFRLRKLKEHEWNPLLYTQVIGNGMYSLVAREYAPLERRLRNLLRRMDQIPNVIEAAKENLTKPPKIHTETAIRQTDGLISMVERVLPSYFQEAGSLRDSLFFAAGKTVQALKQFREWLKEDLLPRSKGNFRLGKDLYDQKLGFVLQSSLSREEIRDRAEAEMERVREEMFVTALPLYRRFFPDRKLPKTYSEKEKQQIIAAVLERLSENRPTEESIVDEARDYLRQLTEFVRNHQLLTLPDEPIEVITMPEFRRGISVAYCESSGPLEKHRKTFYAVAPPPENWPEERRQSFFREYNRYMLQDLTIHEAMPGHYVQIALSNRFRSPLRAVFASGPFVEGWAVYAEHMMMEAGYDGPEVKMQQLKMYLRAVINALLDQGIHVEGMSKKEAMRLMRKKGFQEEGEAEGKWRRACLTSVQLSTYFVGYQELMDIRKEYKKRMGDAFDLRTFHDELLSYGSPPPKYLRRILFRED